MDRAGAPTEQVSEQQPAGTEPTAATGPPLEPDPAGDRSRGASPQPSSSAAGDPHESPAGEPVNGARGPIAVPGPESPVPVAAPAPLLDDAQLKAFRRKFGSRASLAVLGSGTPVASTGRVDDPLAWSTIKLVQAVRAVRDAGGVAGLSWREKADIAVALRRSDNAAARRLWGDLVAREGSAKAAARALQAEMKRAGDRKTRVALPSPPSFPRQGETRWQPTAQVRFMDSLARGCLLPDRDTRWVLKLMGGVVEEQRWGLLRLRGARAKGGWGPHDGVFQVRQVGVMRARDGGTYAVAVTARPRDGSFASGTAILDRVAAWLDRRVVAAPPAASCT